jgi:hypothetical protein
MIPIPSRMPPEARHPFAHSLPGGAPAWNARPAGNPRSPTASGPGPLRGAGDPPSHHDTPDRNTSPNRVIGWNARGLQASFRGCGPGGEPIRGRERKQPPGSRPLRARRPAPAVPWVPSVPLAAVRSRAQAPAARPRPEPVRGGRIDSPGVRHDRRAARPRLRADSHFECTNRTCLVTHNQPGLCGQCRRVNAMFPCLVYRPLQRATACGHGPARTEAMARHGDLH